VGCGHADSPVPVAGVVSLDGKPLAEATVTFDPQLATQIVYIGTTNNEGRFTLGNSYGSSDGAPAGTYRVTISTAKPLTSGKIDENTKFSPEVVPPHYRDGSQKFTVPPGGNTAANFDLHSR
jgi:hypothetical protein